MMKMEKKVTIMMQIEDIEKSFAENEGFLSAEDFAFLVDRAKRSVRKGSGNKGESKAHKENVALGEQVLDLIAEKESVTVKDVENLLNVSNQKASAILKALGNQVVKTERKGKVPASWALAEE